MKWKSTSINEEKAIAVLTENDARKRSDLVSEWVREWVADWKSRNVPQDA